jgi:DNA-binding CsgD family transcriptional regulator
MTPITDLSRRELDVVKQLLQGKSNKQIALSLNIADRTVEFHLTNIYAKFQVSSRIELILALGESTGDAITAKPGYSTVDNPAGNADTDDTPNASLDWAQSFSESVSLISKESELKTYRTFYISNALLWAAAILASAIVGAPIILSTVLLPALAVTFILFTGPKLSRTEPQG